MSVCVYIYIDNVVPLARVFTISNLVECDEDIGCVGDIVTWCCCAVYVWFFGRLLRQRSWLRSQYFGTFNIDEAIKAPVKGYFTSENILALDD